MANHTHSTPPWGAFPLSTRQAILLNLYRYAPLGRKRLRAAALDALQQGGRSRHDIEVRGIRTRCYPGDNASERKLLFNGARKDRIQLQQVLKHLHPGDIFVDVGANFGLYTLHAAKAVGRDGRVIAIEPNPEMAKRLRFNISSNGLTNVEIAELAVGEASGEAILNFDPLRHGGGTVVDMPFGASHVVQILPLVELLDRNGIRRVDGLKIDVEGFEDRVLMPLLANGPRSLWPRMILMEVSWRERWRADCIATLLGAGYRQTRHGRSDVALVLGH